MVNIFKGMEGKIMAVYEERLCQDKVWDGSEHDGPKSFDELVNMVRDHTELALSQANANDWEDAERRMIQVAALAVAAVEWVDQNKVSNLVTR